MKKLRIPFSRGTPLSFGNHPTTSRQTVPKTANFPKDLKWYFQSHIIMDTDMPGCPDSPIWASDSSAAALRMRALEALEDAEEPSKLYPSFTIDTTFNLSDGLSHPNSSRAPHDQVRAYASLHAPHKRHRYRGLIWGPAPSPSANVRSSSSVAGSNSSLDSTVSKASQRSWDNDDEFDQVLQEIARDLTEHIAIIKKASHLTSVLTSKGRSRRAAERQMIQELSGFSGIAKRGLQSFGYTSTTAEAEQSGGGEDQDHSSYDSHQPVREHRAIRGEPYSAREIYRLSHHYRLSVC